MDFDKIKQNILNSSETSTSESESISNSELHEEFEINNFLPEFEPLKLSGKNLAQQYVSAFNTGMNVYQCLNYLQGYVYTLVTAMNETIEAWNTVVPLLEQATKEWTDEEFDYKWSILKPQVIELVTNLTLETFNKAWEDLKPVVIKLAQDTTDAEFKKQWDILKPQVITLVEETTTNKFNEEWEKLKPTIIQLSTDTTIEQFNRSWEELRPQVIELSQTTTSNKFDEKWEELRPQVIELAQTTTSNKFDEKWEELQPTLTETVNNLAKTQTTTTFNKKWEELKPQVIELAQTTTNTKFDEKWTELQPTLNTTVENLVNTNLETFKSTLWQEVTKNNDFPFLLPENFGAVGDGVTDDSRAFTECLATANANHKYILLSNKTYFIATSLNEILGIVFIGLHAIIKLSNNVFCSRMQGCNIQRVAFIREKFNYDKKDVFGSLEQTSFYQCLFNDLYYLFTSLDVNMDDIQRYILFDECNFINTGIFNGNSNHITGNEYTISNSYIEFNPDTNITNNFINGSVGGTFIFDNTIFNGKVTSITPIFSTYDDLIYNRCYIDNTKYNTAEIISVSKGLYDKSTLNVLFDDCTIKDSKNELIKTNDNVTDIYINTKIIQSNLTLDTLINSTLECSLWLENNIMNTKPIINSGTGKVNLVEIQQKYSDTSENIFPWTTEPTPTVENNVSLIKFGTADYYVLTESKDKNIKKLDCYFKYDVDYLPNSPYYTNNIYFRDLDLEGYTVKRSLLTNNTCKLKNKSTGDLIDYVYFMLDDNVTVTTIKDPQIVMTGIAMKYLPYFAKLKTNTPVTGQCYVDMCISVILEKTSS
jgi:hypothetical protein